MIPTIGYIILFLLFSGVYAFFMLYMMKKKKAKAIENFNVQNQKQHAVLFTKEGLENQYAYLKEDLKGKSIDAFTQCKEYKSTGQQATKLAKQFIKSGIRKAIVGTSVGGTEQPSHCLLVISGTELHFLKYQRGEDVVHQIFTKDQVSKAEIEKMDRATMQSSLNMGDYTDYLLTIQNNYGEHKFIVYQYFTEIGGDLTSSFKDSYYKELTKFEVIALHFKETFQNIYGKSFSESL